MTRGGDNALEYFRPHENEQYILSEQNIERDHRDFMDKNIHNAICVRDCLSKRTSQDNLFASE